MKETRQEKILKILEWIGLNNNESKIYLALLKLWKSWVTDISHKSWIKRTTIYSYLNPLLEKDFIKRTIVGKRILFMAENPDKLLRIFEKRKNKFIENIDILKDLYDNKSEKPTLEFYEWINWVKDTYETVWSSWKLVLTFFSPETFYKYFSEEYDKKLTSLEIKNWWKTHNLLRFWDVSKKHLKADFTSNISKVLPKWLDLETDVILVNEKIYLISFDPMYVVILKNKPFFNFYLNLHKYFWNTL